MIKKIYLLLILASFSIASSYAQEKKTQAILYADKYFAVEDYYLAAEYYNKEIEANPNNGYASFQLAECYRNFFDYDNAEKWYKRADETAGDQYPLAGYYHAMMLKVNGKYQQAVEKFEYFIATYTSQGSNDEFLKMANLHYNGAILALDALKKPQRDYSFQNAGAPVNTEYSEFSPIIWESDSSLILASGRITKENEDVYGRFGEAFLDYYRFEISGEEGWRQVFKGERPDKFEALNTKFHDATGVFSPEKDKFYYMRCSEKGTGGNVGCAIFVVKKENEAWGKSQKLNENINKGSWNGHPTLSSKGDTMFFASEREGGLGMKDIWFSALESGDESWGEAVNMGPDVNSELTDYFPNYYSEDNVLFYTSYGKEGLGGADIYMARGEGFKTVRNIGLPFNSNRDDLCMVLGDEKGYLASNRDGGLGSDDIYLFNIRSKEALIAEIETDTIEAELITIKGRIVDDAGIPVPDVKVLLLNAETDEVLKMTYTDYDGVFIFANLDPSINYKVILDEDAARNLTAEIDYNIDDLEIIATGEPIVAAVVDEPVLDDPVNNLVEDNTSDETIEEDVVVVDEQEEVIEEPTPIEEIDQLVAADKPFKVLFENIYYDFNKSSVRAEGKKVLDELAAYAKENTSVKIEITAHTDNLGSNEYNYSLAKKRGYSAHAYLLKQGVPKSAIIVNSVGEDKPLATNANDIGRQLNRRVEFHVSGGSSYEANAMVYVVPERTTIESIAQQFNMNEEELKAMNGLSGSDLAAFRPVRVRRTSSDDIIASESMSFTGAVSSQTNLPSDSPYFDKDAATTGSRETIEVANTGYNAGVKYYKYDGSGYHVVLPRNTLFSIANLCGSSVDEIASLNNLSGNRIYPGQRLKVSENASGSPVYNESSNTVSNNVSLDIPSESGKVYTPLADAGMKVSDQHGQIIDLGDGKRYVVAQGDNFYSICKRFNMSFDELKMMNGLTDYVLYVGQALKIKEGEEGTSTEKEETPVQVEKEEEEVETESEDDF